MSAGKTVAVVVASGRGTRAGLNYNKVFYKLAGRTVLNRCLDALSGSGRLDSIVLVLSADDFPAYTALCREEGCNALVKKVVSGGDTRQKSVKNGLDAVDKDAEIVLIHDGARPFISREMILAVLDDVEKYGSGVISTPVYDTVKVVDAEGYAVATPERSTLRAVQTPQGFRYAEIMAAHEEALRLGLTATDDAALYERKYARVKLTTIADAERNVKLTTPADFARAERAFAFPRLGTGYDVHRLVEGRKLILCGVEVPYEKGLLGHSDADVALHALMDAMLGAAALGDIGHLFPDHDDRYKGISSLILLAETAKALEKAGFVLYNADITIVCQKPKLAPYIGQMRQNIADQLAVPVSAISVKATTTEKLGFEGEGLGISAQAVATVTYKGEK